LVENHIAKGKKTCIIQFSGLQRNTNAHNHAHTCLLVVVCCVLDFYRAVGLKAVVCRDAVCGHFKQSEETSVLVPFSHVLKQEFLIEASKTILARNNIALKTNSYMYAGSRIKVEALLR